MEFKTDTENGYIILIPQDNIKTSAAKEFEQKMLELISENGRIVVDLAAIDYVCSSGLRALLAAQQAVDALDDGELIIRNVKEDVMYIFNSTGFNNVLSIQ